jgi:large subunit ribosomal protein L28
MKKNNSLRHTRCFVTGKSSLYGNRRSHALNATRHAQKPNLQPIRIQLEDGTIARVKVSAKALKKNNLTRV